MQAGSRLGPYEIVARIGAGGMGEVWKARDTRLERSVAIKILPAEIAADAELKLRFEREAKTISQLSHPNICTLFDVGDGYLVMELLEGETLADRIARGPLPLAEVLRYGAQIAEALDRAHRAGVVHRDLKPGNVMLTKAGAKLLDFGLAKSAIIELTTDGATMQKPLTREGTILGTFQYMAPEQLEGVEADARTDIFALGAVLYEMASGQRAFEGKTKTSLIAAIVGGTPRPIADLLPLAPNALDHVISKCLAKDPDGRWQSAHDIADELQWIAQRENSPDVPHAPGRSGRLGRVAWPTLAMLALAAAVFLATRKPAAMPRIETALLPPPDVAISYVGGPLAFSPDGRRIAFVGRNADGRSMIWIRSLASSNAQPVAGTDGGTFPFWAPDGRSIAFGAHDKLQKVLVSGGTPDVLTYATLFTGGSWSASGDIVFTDTHGIQRVSAAGGDPELIFPGTRSAPSFLPDGKRFVFAERRRNAKSTLPEGLNMASLTDRRAKRVLPDLYSNVAYVPGWLLYIRDGALRAQRLNPKTLEAVSDPVTITEHVQYDPDTISGVFGASSSGIIAYVEGEGAGKSELVWVSAEGKDLGVIAPPAMYYSPRLSHDGKRVVVDVSDEQTARGDIWIFDIARATSTRLTYDPANESVPVWSPDDRYVYYFSEKGPTRDLYRTAASGTGSQELILSNANRKMPVEVSPDGRTLAYVEMQPKRNDYDISLVDVETHQSRPLLNTPFNETALSFSRDGRFIAYTSDESGREEVYVQPFPVASAKWVVSRGGGAFPSWSFDGKRLFYLSPERKLMAVTITEGAMFEAGTPVVLFDAHVRGLLTYRQYEMSPDGSKFLLNRVVGEEGTRPITLVQNWTNGLAP
ncbi:MAG: protein kinase [Acidobacteriota bacterium]